MGNTKKTAARRLGQQGEQAVAAWYRKAGYTIVERNWRCFEGEIDIIAQKGRTTVICEVKTRTTDRFMDPALSISPAKQAKLRTAAFRWRDENPGSRSMRFDVALVIGGEIRVIEGAF